MLLNHIALTHLTSVARARSISPTLTPSKFRQLSVSVLAAGMIVHGNFVVPRDFLSCTLDDRISALARVDWHNRQLPT